MNFTEIAAILLPEGEVVKIEVGGVVIWEKESDGE